MPRDHKYQLSKSRQGDGSFLWFIALLLVGGIAWVIWQHGKTPGFKARAAQATNRPVINTNLVRVSALQAVVTNVPIPVATNVTLPATIQVATNPPPPAGTNGFPRPVRDALEAQIALARLGISAGSIDGVTGSQTAAALKAFQRQRSLPVTGQLDAETKAFLFLTNPPAISYVVTSNDLARLQPLSSTWLGKSQQTALDYESILELVAERGRASPNLVRRLNPGVNWTNVLVGTEIKIPDTTNAVPVTKAAFAAISLSEKRLQIFDVGTNLLAHFPCSIAQRVEKRPVGELHIKAVAPNPDYTFNPEVFPESEEARQIKSKLILPPGPNNPVGTAWVSLDLPGYGIHGTPKPEDVGRTESHGCFRLANWNAEHFLKLAWVGMPIYVEP